MAHDEPSRSPEAEDSQQSPIVAEEYRIPLAFGGLQAIRTPGSTNRDISELVCEYKRADGGPDT